jgi:hypothetical protein
VPQKVKETLNKLKVKDAVWLSDASASDKSLQTEGGKPPIPPSSLGKPSSLPAYFQVTSGELAATMTEESSSALANTDTQPLINGANDRPNGSDVANEEVEIDCHRVQVFLPSYSGQRTEQILSHMQQLGIGEPASRTSIW